jgi:hypothetical protein
MTVHEPAVPSGIATPGPAACARFAEGIRGKHFVAPALRPGPLLVLRMLNRVRRSGPSDAVNGTSTERSSAIHRAVRPGLGVDVVRSGPAAEGPLVSPIARTPDLPRLAPAWGSRQLVQRKPLAAVVNRPNAVAMGRVAADPPPRGAGTVRRPAMPTVVTGADRGQAAGRHEPVPFPAPEVPADWRHAVDAVARKQPPGQAGPLVIVARHESRGVVPASGRAAAVALRVPTAQPIPALSFDTGSRRLVQRKPLAAVVNRAGAAAMGLRAASPQPMGEGTAWRPATPAAVAGADRGPASGRHGPVPFRASGVPADTRRPVDRGGREQLQGHAGPLVMAALHECPKAGRSRPSPVGIQQGGRATLAGESRGAAPVSGRAASTPSAQPKQAVDLQAQRGAQPWMLPWQPSSLRRRIAGYRDTGPTPGLLLPGFQAPVPRKSPVLGADNGRPIPVRPGMAAPAGEAGVARKTASIRASDAPMQAPLTVASPLTPWGPAPGLRLPTLRPDRLRPADLAVGAHRRVPAPLPTVSTRSEAIPDAPVTARRAGVPGRVVPGIGEVALSLRKVPAPASSSAPVAAAPTLVSATLAAAPSSTANAAAPPADATAQAPLPPLPIQALADRVFSLLERRLVVERERRGVRS